MKFRTTSTMTKQIPLDILFSFSCLISLPSYTDMRSISLQKVNQWKLPRPHATNRLWNLYQFGLKSRCLASCIAALCLVEID